MCAGFAASRAPQTVQQRVPLLAPVELAAVQPGPWLRPATTYSLTEKEARARGTKQQNSQAETTNKRRTNQPQPEKESPSGGCV